MATDNRLWGAERIRGELLKLGIHVSKRTIQKYMRSVRNGRPGGQQWSTFPRIDHGGNIAAYIPSLDRIVMPPRESFTSREEYYSALFHELVHSTGSAGRLNRKAITDPSGFGSHAYSFEELVAECGSAFLCSEGEIVNSTI